MPPGAKDTPCPPSLPQSSPQHPMPRGGGPRSDGLWSKKSCSNAHPGSTVSPLPPKLAMVWVGGLSLLGGGHPPTPWCPLSLPLSTLLSLSCHPQPSGLNPRAAEGLPGLYGVPPSPGCVRGTFPWAVTSLPATPKSLLAWKCCIYKSIFFLLCNLSMV